MPSLIPEDCEHVGAFQTLMLAAATQLAEKCMGCEKKDTCGFPTFMAQGIETAKQWLQNGGLM